jgi:hypothetical protein
MTASVDLLAQVILGGLLELAQDERGDLLGGVGLVADGDADEFVGAAGHLVGDVLLFGADLAVAPAHEALDREDRVLGVGHLLVLGGLAHEPLALVGEAHHRGVVRLPEALIRTLGSSPSITATHGVGRAEVDADDLGHGAYSFLSRGGGREPADRGVENRTAMSVPVPGSALRVDTGSRRPAPPARSQSDRTAPAHRSIRAPRDAPNPRTGRGPHSAFPFSGIFENKARGS